MIQVTSGSEIVFRPVSESDDRIRGEVKLKNPHSNRYIAYKIKCTEVSAFDAQPSRGIIQPHQQVNSQIITNKAADAEYCKILSTKNKFMVQYLLLDKKPNSFDEISAGFKGPACQNIKIFINTSSIRHGSSRIKSNISPSVVGSNLYSFHSMMPKTGQIRQDRMVQNQPEEDELKKLKENIQILQKKRARLSRSTTKGNKQSGGYLKYAILFAIGVISGNTISHYVGLNRKIDKFQITPKRQHKQESFWSIFNFGSHQDKAWWDIL